MFRRAVSIADNIDIWVSKTFNLEPKHHLLVIAQDTITCLLYTSDAADE